MFWLNLVMVPLLGAVVLPLCLLALCISILYQSQPPLIPWETEIFKLTEWAIQIWLRVMQELHQVGGWAVLEGRLDWEAGHYLFYYGLTLLLAFGLIRLKGFILNKPQRFPEIHPSTRVEAP